LIPVSQQWVLGIGLLPLVRAVSAGDGLHMVEWTAVGAFLGLTYANRRVVLDSEVLQFEMSTVEEAVGSAAPQIGRMRVDSRRAAAGFRDPTIGSQG
ncbi:MAG: hypothetical protein M3011_04845, partial [Actinomycetota bacterium]|nr:hypothetical protein [Actinomycetota bacterium]